MAPPPRKPRRNGGTSTATTGTAQASTQSTFDLTQAVLNGAVTLNKPETPEERAERVGKERRREQIDNGKEITLFVIGVLVVLGASAVCFWKAFLDPNASAEVQKWTLSSLTLILGSLLGHIVKKP